MTNLLPACLPSHHFSACRQRRAGAADLPNNDGWWDDTSDGPIRATIVLTSGDRIEAAPAWAIVAPPKYAPELANLVTLYDAIFDVAVRFQGARPDLYQNG